MKSVRVVGVGLLLCAALMGSFGGEFFRWWMHDSASYVVLTAASVLSPTIASASGMQLVGGLTFAILCLGLGLLVSAVVYSTLEDIVFGIVHEVTYLVAQGVRKLGSVVKQRFLRASRFA